MREKHGHWIEKENVISWEGHFSMYVCSACNKGFLDDLCENNGTEIVDAYKDFKYCPFCGTRMDGEDIVQSHNRLD